MVVVLAVGVRAVCTLTCKVVGGQIALVICFVWRAEAGTVVIQKGSEVASSTHLQQRGSRWAVLVNF